MKLTSPCHENYNKMPKSGSGRYCESCNKVVIDFTKMTDLEVQEYFKEHVGQDICGRAKGIQLGKQNAFEHFLFNCKHFISKKINVRPLRIALLGIISGLMTFTTSCMGKMMPRDQVYTHPSGDTVKTNSKPVRNDKK